MGGMRTAKGANNVGDGGLEILKEGGGGVGKSANFDGAV